MGMVKKDSGVVKEKPPPHFNCCSSLCGLFTLSLVFSPVLQGGYWSQWWETHVSGQLWCCAMPPRGGGGKEKEKKGKERQERKELWYSQPPQTIPPLMCSESRRAARPSWFLNHFLQERLSTCSWAGFSQGWNARRLSPSECLWLLSSFLELQPQRWKGLARRRWEAGWTCLFQGVDPAPSHIIETHAPYLVRAGSPVKT